MNDFQIEWEKQEVTCPMGKTSWTWWPVAKLRRGKPAIHIHFRQSDCLVCAARSRCTRSTSAARALTILPQAQQMALQSARQRQTSDEFKARYALRSGIEGAIALVTNKLGMRRSRYWGETKTHLHDLMTAAAVNLMRYLAWIDGIPRSAARQSHILALKPA